MALFMDIHVVEDEAFNDIAAMQGHHKDIAVQHKYGVKSLKYFLNLPEKKVFCLLEAPHKKACVDLHIEAHGIGACNVIELSSEIDFKAFLGEGTKNEDDLALTITGEIDTGYRTLMMISLVDFSGRFGRNTIADKLHHLIKENRGSAINHPSNTIMASFVRASDAISCCMASFSLLEFSQCNIDYIMALVTGKPVDEVGSDFFGETKERLNTLCQIGLSKSVYIDAATNALAKGQSKTEVNDQTKIVFVSEADFSFCGRLFKILDEKINDSNFKSEHLYKHLGLSKAKAYRKLKWLTGMSPNELIREVRLRRSLNELRNSNKNIAEIGYDLGFNSPTYFTRVFRKRFDILPTEFAKLSNPHM